MQIGVESDKAVDHRRVFVVDNDEITRAALQFMLHDEIETHDLPDLNAAYSKAVDWRPDVLLLGINVVQAQGIEVLAEIHQRIPGLRIILVAESAKDALAQACLKQGVGSILTKPLTIENARRKVDAILGRKVPLAIPVVQI